VGCGQDTETTGGEGEYQAVTDAFVEAWIDFYPSRAVALGLDQHLSSAEDRSAERIARWVSTNEETLSRIDAAPSTLSLDLRIDLRLIRDQIARELLAWGEEEEHLHSPTMYGRTLRRLLDVPHEPERMNPSALGPAVAHRLDEATELVRAMRDQLVSGTAGERDQAIRALRGAVETVEELAQRFPEHVVQVEGFGEEVESAVAYLESELEITPDADDFRLGREEFAQQLRLYYGTDLTPEELAERALAEIETVRGIMAQVSAEYLQEAHPNHAIPDELGALVQRALADMEENRSSTEAEALEAFQRFADEAEAFVRDAEIATLPSDKTLEIVLTRESAGPAQRIGFVASAPPFDPTPLTSLSIPTIPDDFPEDEKEDFYRSFNNHFNKAIIIHELFPGHYMQLKIASENPRRVRIFFPYEPYIEGWATLVEILALDAGWDDFNKLTYLAHLRKRLENANRAYTSVQVHCFGWTEEEVARFSRERSLLAPQFAASLWGRLQRGPMQMTSYFVGKDMFAEVLEAERERLGEEFRVRDFSDAILRAGAVPMEMIPEILQSN
jgi:uncharacterized protein (DUF885 family)